MPGGNPTPLGQAAVSGALIPDAGSPIKTNQFGVDKGTIRHGLGDQAKAQNARPVPGVPYTGPLPQFKGFLVDDSDILGAEARAAYVNIAYARINPLYKPRVFLDTELHWVRPPQLAIQDLFVSLTAEYPNIALPEPTARIVYSDTKPVIITSSGQLYSSSNPAVKDLLPPTPDFVLRLTTATVILPTATVILPDTKIDLVPVDIFYGPNSQGWQLVKNKCDPICGGAIYEIDQQWRCFYFFKGAKLVKKGS